MPILQSLKARAESLASEPEGRRLVLERLLAAPPFDRHRLFNSLIRGLGGSPALAWAFSFKRRALKQLQAAKNDCRNARHRVDVSEERVEIAKTYRSCEQAYREAKARYKFLLKKELAAIAMGLDGKPLA